MLSSVLNSNRAIEVNLTIMRAFVRLRKMIDCHSELALKLVDLERHIKSQDERIQTIFEAIQQLMAPHEEKGKKKIGFTVKEKQKAFGRRARKN